MTELIQTTQEQTIEDELIYLFEVALSDGGFVYFHSGFNEHDTTYDYNAEPRQYAGTIEFKNINYPSDPAINTYFPLPCAIEGMEYSKEGPQSRPRLTLANILDVYQEEFNAQLTNEDMLGNRIIIRTTLRKYLMASIPGGTATDDGTTAAVEFPRGVFVIDRIAESNPSIVSFELASPMDLPNVTLPGRRTVGKYCSWRYKGFLDTPSVGGCKWKPSSQGLDQNYYFFNLLDEPIVSMDAILTSSWPAWSSGGSNYAADSTVIHNGIYYMANGEVSASIEPGTAQAYRSWIPIRSWTSWQLSTSYENNLDDPYASDYVLYPGEPGSRYENANVNKGIPTIWRCVRSHISSTANNPKEGSTYWELAEVCGKTIQSCKIRFQAILKEGSGRRTIPSVTQFNTAVVLPFGGFPGMVKF